MKKLHANADGIIDDVFYEERIKDFRLDSWKKFQKLVDKIKKIIGLPSIVLDLGSGEGFFAKCCQENRLNVIALEGSKSAVEWSRNVLGIDARVHNLKDPLPFGDNTIDFIMSHDVYEHLPQQINENVFRESLRVLKPKGILWITTLCKYDFVERAGPEHITMTTPTGLSRLGKRFGFSATILRPNFNISLFTPNFFDKDLNYSLRQKRFRDWLKRNQRRIDFVLAPFWIPLWYLNSRFLFFEPLDFVSHKSIVIFTKPKN